MDKNNGILDLCEAFKKLPGIGERSAKRIVIAMILDKNLTKVINKNIQKIIYESCYCELCNNIDIKKICGICLDQKRDKKKLCIIENINNLWTIEEARIFRGVYHILHTKSVRNNFKESLLQHIKVLKELEEVIIATNYTTTSIIDAYQINTFLKETNPSLKITILAQGIPLGGEIEYLDERTLDCAFKNRKIFKENMNEENNID